MPSRRGHCRRSFQLLAHYLHCQSQLCPQNMKRCLVRGILFVERGHKNLTGNGIFAGLTFFVGDFFFFFQFGEQSATGSVTARRGEVKGECPIGPSSRQTVFTHSFLLPPPGTLAAVRGGQREGRGQRQVWGVQRLMLWTSTVALPPVSWVPCGSAL